MNLIPDLRSPGSFACRCMFGVTLLSAFLGNDATAQPAVADSSRASQRQVVKVYGAGGMSGLEAYQSGFIVSPEGHIATVWSYVLDVDPVVVLDDGRRFESEIVGFEPALELAVLKVDASDLPFFSLPETDSKDQSDTKLGGVSWGDPVLAVSNLFNIASGNEPASVMQGRIAAISDLDARRGTFKTAYRGKVLVLDLIANNPGAAGGAVVGSDGQLVGMLGKELRDGASGVWLNYALPASVLRKPIGDIIAGRTTQVNTETMPMLPRSDSHALSALGITMIPDVLESTPAYVDEIKPKTAAHRGGLRPDDLVLMVAGRRIESQRTLVDLLRRIDRRDDVEMTIQRGNEILPVSIRP